MTPDNRIVTFSAGDRQGYGILREDGLVDLSRRRVADWPDFSRFVQEGGMARLAELSDGTDIDLSEDAFSYRPPLVRGARILCVGVNYPDRAEEYAGAVTAPDYPSIFVRFASSFVGHGARLVRPNESVQLDYEGEIAIVIGKAGRRIPEHRALDHVGALTLANDGSVRDWMRHGKFNVTQGKNFDRSGAMGPWLVPFVDESQIADVVLTTRVNGETRQSDRTGRMLFDFRRLISYISTFTTLSPGDVILCGTPAGAGARLDPPIWLKPGDIVEVEAEGLGVLRNGVGTEDAAAANPAAPDS